MVKRDCRGRRIRSSTPVAVGHTEAGQATCSTWAARRRRRTTGAAGPTQQPRPRVEDEHSRRHVGCTCPRFRPDTSVGAEYAGDCCRCPCHRPVRPLIARKSCSAQPNAARRAAVRAAGHPDSSLPRIPRGHERMTPRRRRHPRIAGGAGERTIRDRVRAALTDGSLAPIDKISTWVGFGIDIPCRVCDELISRHQIEQEIIIDDVLVFVHATCLLIWREESRSRTTPPPMPT